jgi:carbonic anhydrase
MEQRTWSSNEAAKLLSDGNERFVRGANQRPNQDESRRSETLRNGQRPFAAILSCSDSRVPVEIIFDRGIGDIFSIRVAGNVTGVGQLDSIEYCIEHLGVNLLVVLGHSCCGAVKAALGLDLSEEDVPEVIKRIRPSIIETRENMDSECGTPIEDQVAKANAWKTIDQIVRDSEIVKRSVKDGKLEIRSAFYDMESGRVEWLGIYPINKV